MALEIRENVSLAELTTLKIGGKARYFCAAQNEDEVREAVEFAEQNKLQIFVLGGGSNVLIADEGFDGLVLQISLKGISIFQEKGAAVCVTARAGEDWDQFVAFCVEKNLQGVECLSGIPGFVGGTPVQNVGAYGQEVSQTIVSVRVFERKTKFFSDLLNWQCDFSYRTSIFNITQKDIYIVLAVTFCLTPDGEPRIDYRDLREIFADKKPTLAETRNAVLNIRRAKSMIIDKQDANSKSAGSFFKNPIVSNEKYLEIRERAESLNIGDVPSFIVDKKSKKIPAAWLIENSGFHKGYARGQAGISSKHTLALINRGAANAKDMTELMREIQSKVLEVFGIMLMPEPVFVGF
jgi:UDP-N-acetylmuramate dehydrogenase